ncbi:hypothetical protein chiPu_0031006, partial [Chiloscyllium punctatum]|nr:hypothetical protein [Chiloscyllium punctatum]
SAAPEEVHVAVVGNGDRAGAVVRDARAPEAEGCVVVEVEGVVRRACAEGPAGDGVSCRGAWRDHQVGLRRGAENGRGGLSVRHHPAVPVGGVGVVATGRSGAPRRRLRPRCVSGDRQRGRGQQGRAEQAVHDATRRSRNRS